MSFYLSDSYTLLIIGSSLIFSGLFFFNRERILVLLEYFINQKYSLIYHRKDPLIYNLITSINSLIVFSIIISFYIFSIQQSFSWFDLLKIASIILILFFFRLFIIYFLGFILEITEFSKKYYYGYSTGLYLISLIFFPVILFISYFKEGLLIQNTSIYIFYLFLVFYFLLKIILLNRLNLFKITFVFYNILYLCALEVLPYLVLFKLIH